MNCPCHRKDSLNAHLLHKLVSVEQELVDVAKKMVRTANDPVSAVIRFLHERPENKSLPGYLIKRVLLETFGAKEQIPGLINLFASHVKEIIRQSNVISIVNEHPAVEKWGSYVIKQTGRIKFEVARERDKLVLKNINGLIAIEHGIEVGLDKILINPPKLEVTLKMGLLRPQRIIDIV